MGKIDTVTKDYLSNSEIFADVFNYFIYEGESVVDASCLRELDTTVIALPYGDDGAEETIQQYRDVMKYLVAMEDEDVAYLLLGIEAQAKINYAMPVRDMLYDALQYYKQVVMAARSHRKAGNRGESDEDFLSGFHKDDELVPVVTLVVLFDAKEWDGKLSLHEMFPKKTDKRVLCLIPDYKINLLTPTGIDDPDFEKFRTGFGAAMKYIKYSNNKNELKRVLEENRDFWTVDRETAKVIETVTGTDLRIKESEVCVNVCKAVEDLQRDAEIRATIKTYRKCKYTDESIIKEIMAEFQLSAEEAKQFVEERNLALA